MSRKTIQISLPSAPPAPKPPAPKAVGTGSSLESWVTQARDAAEDARVETPAAKGVRESGMAFTVRLSSEPDWFEAAKIFFVLPQAALWFWGLGLAQRSMRDPFGRR
jgi:hypothetical protein